MRYPLPLTMAIGIGSAAMIATVIVPSALHAQTIVPAPDSGCYVPRTGSAYVIKSPGTPTDCVRKTHNKFPWRAVAPSVVLSGGSVQELPSLDDARFFGPFMHPGSGEEDGSVAEVPPPNGGTVSNVRFFVWPAPDRDWSMTLYKNGTSQDNCLIFPPNTNCSLPGSYSFAPGDKIVITARSRNSTPGRFSWVATLQ